MTEHKTRKPGTKPENKDTKPASPARTDLPGPGAEVLALQDTAGNQAVSRAVPAAGGQPLDPPLRAEMEQSLGADFGDVRLHDDPAARAQSDALDAVAFTQGEDIYLGTDAPSRQDPAAKALLAHELAHVVQQRQAATIPPGVSRPGDRAETQAGAVAARAAQGQRVRVPPASTVPAIQREKRNKEPASREEVAAALTEFFKRSQAERGDKEFRITPQVRTAVQLVFRDDPMGWLAAESLLNRLDIPGDPAKFAQELAGRLTQPVNPRVLDHLKKRAVKEAEPGRLGRLKGLIKRTKPGKAPRPNVPDPLASQKRFEQGVKDLEKAGGGQQPQPPGGAGSKAKALILKPRSVDVLRAGRILGGLPEAIRGPKPAAKPVRAVSPEVVKAIQAKVPSRPLVPAGSKQDPGNFPDSQEIALQLARLLDEAHESGSKSISLDLGGQYEAGKTMLPVLKELKRIAGVVKAALPHHASGVSKLEVHYAGKVAPLTIE